MNLGALLDQRPVIVVLAGPNGAGKSTFHSAFLSDSGLRFINADNLAKDLQLKPYDAAALAGGIRHELVARRESFIFETVFSDPVGDKVTFLRRAADSGYTIILCFIGLDSAETSDERVAMRVTQGGHDVPPRKVKSRYRRTLKNLGRAITSLPVVLVYDNSDLTKPFRPIARFIEGRVAWASSKQPEWLKAVVG